MSSLVRFDDALVRMVDWARTCRMGSGGDVLLLRDLTGHLRVLTDEGGDLSDAEREALHTRLGAFSPGLRGLSLQRSLVGPDDELARDRVLLDDGIWLIDRLVSEQGWNRAPVAPPATVPRITFFGVKGGVGRSTALAALALHLARAGKRVMVVDLDLESPGVTSLLLRTEDLPRYGVTDWMVEDAVGQSDDAVIEDIAIQSLAVGSDVRGEVLVVPAVGSRSIPAYEPEDLSTTLRDGSFVAKLGRAYMPGATDTDFAGRLGRMLGALEARYRPDVVLLDSRAGLHDISAATVPRLGGTVLLFAGATSQTWLAYRLMFSTWRRNAEVLSRFRSRLRVVASQVPEVGRDVYLARIRDEAHALFTSFVYEPDPTPDQDGESDPGLKKNSESRFNFTLDDPDGPHTPLPVYWRRELVEWEPATGGPLTPEQFDAAFGPFLRDVLKLPYVAEAQSEPPAASGDAP